MTARKLLVCALLLAALALSVGAHGYVLRAIPADRSVLERPPTRLQYWFSEDLEPRFSEIKLRDQSGRIIASGGVDDLNQALLALPVPPNLPDGAYIVELRPAFASDGHVIAESRVFFVGDEVGGVSGRAADDRAIPLEALWRAAMNLANFLFFGASALYAMVLLPAWGSGRHEGSALPARVMRRLRNCLIAGIALAFAASVFALAQQSMVFFNTGIDQVLAQNLWQVVLIGSRFGDVWTFRLVLLIFSAVLLGVAEYYRPLMPQLAAGIWRGLPWLGALFIGLTMVTSHAAGSTLMPWLAIAVDWLHALAVGFWLGGTLVLALILPIALSPYAPVERDRARIAVLRRFSLLVTPLVALIIVSGLYTALNFLLTPADIGSSYGRTLGLKLLLALPVLIVGGCQHIALRPQLAARLESALRRTPAFLQKRAIRCRAGALRLEAVLMLILLLAVAWLSATPISEPQSLEQAGVAPQATETVGALTASAAIIPGGPGVNSYDVVLSRAGRAATDLEIHMQWIQPDRAIRSGWRQLDQIEDGFYVATGDELDMPGRWWAILDIIAPEGEPTRLALAWEISAAASIQQLRQPSPLNLLALLLVAIVLLVIVYPAARRALRRLQVGAVTALLALGATVASLGILFFGAGLIAEQQRQYELTLNPPPSVVNAVLPDAESLRRGEALYLEHCLVWQGQSADFRALRNRLDSARDDYLYGTLVDGWRGLPACAGALSERERWDLVNYFRTFEERG